MQQSLYRQFQQSRWRYSVTVAASFITCILVLDSLWLKSAEHQQSPEDALMQQMSSAIVNSDAKTIEAIHQAMLNDGIETSLLSNEQLHNESSINNPVSKITIDGDEFWLLCSTEKTCLIIKAEKQSQANPLPTLLFYCVVIGLVIVWLKPVFSGLANLERAAQRFAKTPSEMKVSGSTPYPVKPLAVHFDAMASKIHSLLAMQKDITHGLSHELRTPLARLKFAMAGINPEAIDSNLYQSIQTDITEIEALADTILYYARLEHSDQIKNLETIPLGVLLESIEHNATTQRAITLTVEGELTELTCDTELMKLTINNLVSNAYRFAHSKIIVSALVDKGVNTVRITDDGPGIPENEIHNVIKPFIKGKQSKGFGFGLAFCQRIATLHNGTLRIANLQPNGCCIEISWTKKSPLN